MVRANHGPSMNAMGPVNLQHPELFSKFLGTSMRVRGQRLDGMKSSRNLFGPRDVFGMVDSRSLALVWSTLSSQPIQTLMTSSRSARRLAAGATLLSLLRLCPNWWKRGINLA